MKFSVIPLLVLFALPVLAEEKCDKDDLIVPGKATCSMAAIAKAQENYQRFVAPIRQDIMESLQYQRSVLTRLKIDLNYQDQKLIKELIKMKPEDRTKHQSAPLFQKISRRNKFFNAISGCPGGEIEPRENQCPMTKSLSLSREAVRNLNVHYDDENKVMKIRACTDRGISNFVGMGKMEYGHFYETCSTLELPSGKITEIESVNDTLQYFLDTEQARFREKSFLKEARWTDTIPSYEIHFTKSESNYVRHEVKRHCGE